MSCCCKPQHLGVLCYKAIDTWNNEWEFDRKHFPDCPSFRVSLPFAMWIGSLFNREVGSVSPSLDSAWALWLVLAARMWEKMIVYQFWAKASGSFVSFCVLSLATLLPPWNQVQVRVLEDYRTCQTEMSARSSHTRPQTYTPVKRFKGI